MIGVVPQPSAEGAGQMADATCWPRRAPRVLLGIEVLLRWCGLVTDGLIGERLTSPHRAPASSASASTASRQSADAGAASGRFSRV